MTKFRTALLTACATAALGGNANAAATATRIATNGPWETWQSTTAAGAPESCFIRVHSSNDWFLTVGAGVGGNRFLLILASDSFAAKPAKKALDFQINGFQPWHAIDNEIITQDHSFIVTIPAASAREFVHELTAGNTIHLDYANGGTWDVPLAGTTPAWEAMMPCLKTTAPLAVAALPQAQPATQPFGATAFAPPTAPAPAPVASVAPPPPPAATTVIGETPTCTIEQATGQIQFDDAQLAGRSAQAQLPILAEISQINGKATDPKLSLGDQLNSKDAARFSELTTQLQLMRLSAYVESGHARDAAVVHQMFTAAWKSYLDPNYVPDKNDFPGNVVFLLRLLPPGSNSSPWRQPAGTACTVDFAIANQEQEGFHRINALKPALDRDTAVVQQLRARYGVGADGRLDPSKMPPEDARKLQIVQTELAPRYKEADLSKDLKHIRAWWEIADMIYHTRKEDVATYASIEHIGDTLQAQSSGLNPEQLALIGLWQKIDETVRSDEQRMMDEMSDALRSLQSAPDEATKPAKPATK